MATTVMVEEEEVEMIDSSEDIIDQCRPEAIARNGYPYAIDSGTVLQKAKSDPNEMTAKFIIVTRQDVPNLHGNKVQITPTKLGRGLQLGIHKVAPIVLFEHGDFPFPIGMSERAGKHLVKTGAKKAEAEVVFSQTLPEAAVIFGLVDEGILRMSSIGFLPTKAMRLERHQDGGEDGVEDLTQQMGGLDFIESMLLEWSVVGRGADQGAFKQLLDHGHVNGERLTEGLRPVIQRLAGPKNVWSHGVDLDELQQTHRMGRTSDLEPSEEQARRSTARMPKFNGIESRSDRPWGQVKKTLSAYIDGLLSGVDSNTRWSSLTDEQKEKIASRTLLGNANSSTAGDGMAFPVVNPANDKLNEGGLIAAKAAALGARGARLPTRTAESVVTVANRLLREEFGREVGEDQFVREEASVYSLTEQSKEQSIAMSSTSVKPDTLRWNRKLSQHFDVPREHLEPSSLEHDWISRFCNCQVKELQNLTSSIPSLHMGSWLTGLENILLENDFKTEDVRNLTGTHESPPVYDLIQLNSQLSDDFLVEGLQFVRRQSDRKNLVFKFIPTYYGIKIKCYMAKWDLETGGEILSASNEWSKQNNFLKGEAFSLSGQFIKQTNEEWDSVFLKEENAKPIRRLVNDFNSKKSKVRKRGMILMGPPGTGKTMTGRIMRNQLKEVTFIWVSARDFWRMGSFGGFSMAIDLARDLSPSVIFFEDVDNWLSSRSVDLLKSEMDGIAQMEGVATLLTTNFPERLPQALLDRPGRFDDVLKFDLPDSKLRSQMMRSWLQTEEHQNISDDAMQRVVEETEGYSGAHLRELVMYAIALQEEDSEITLEESMSQALDKIAKQRELIDEVQLGGSNYKPVHHDVATSYEHVEIAQSEQLVTRHVFSMDGIGKTIAERLGPSMEQRIQKSLLSAMNQTIQKGFEGVEKQCAEAIESRIRERVGNLS